jgi:hypothetical protein
LRFLAVRRIEPRWWSSMRWRIWGVTSVPSHPIISIWPIALELHVSAVLMQYADGEGKERERYQSRSRHSGSRSPSSLAMFKAAIGELSREKGALSR